MPASALSSPHIEAPEQHNHLEFGTIDSPETDAHYPPSESSETAVEAYTKQARLLYEAQPRMTLLGLIRLMWGVIVTRTAPRTYKL